VPQLESLRVFIILIIRYRIASRNIDWVPKATISFRILDFIVTTEQGLVRLCSAVPPPLPL
jgi:hypothetical protein